MMNTTAEPRPDNDGARLISVIGIGCPLFCDQGFGISIVQCLHDTYDFPENVRLLDGTAAGVSLTGLVAQSDHVIAVDAMRNGGKPGDLYRLEGNRIFERLAGKNHVQHVAFVEALAHCHALDHPPQAVLLGIEPEDTETVVCELTPALQKQIKTVIKMVLAELDRLGVIYSKKGKSASCV